MKISNSIMKPNWLSAFFLVVLTGRIAWADIGPGWYMQPLMIPSHPQKVSTVQYPVAPQQNYNGPITSLPQTTQPTEISEEQTDEIKSLARNLENDPRRIFDYVHNYIQYVHYFGSKKGAYLTFLEGSGNDFDQCALLVALLRAAKANDSTANNYTVSYQFGMMRIPYESPDNVDLKHWLGLKLPGGPGKGDDDLDLIDNLYKGGGFPLYLPHPTDENLNRYVLVPWVNGQADKTSFFVHRVWVKLDYGSGTGPLGCPGPQTSIYYLDPSFKTGSLIGGLDLSTAMGLNTEDLFADARIPHRPPLNPPPIFVATPVVVTPNYVQNLNYSAISNRLVAYAGNLLGQFQTSYKNLSVEDVISGYRIQESETCAFQGLPFRPQDTAFHVDNLGSDNLKTIPVLEWQNIPSTYMSTLHLQIDWDATAGKYDVDKTYKFPELKARKLTLTFQSKKARLSLDDVEDPGTIGTITTGATASMITTVTNPFGTWDYTANSLGVVLDRDRAVQNDGEYGTVTYQRNAPGYVIAYSFDDPSQLLTRRRQKLDALIRQGLGPQSPEVITETLNVLGLSWFQQTYLAQRIIAGQNDVLVTTLHRVGRVAQERPPDLGYYVDVKMDNIAAYSRSQSIALGRPSQSAFYDMQVFAASAMEHGVIEQLQPKTAASTIKTIYQANEQGIRLILLTPDNVKVQNTVLDWIGGGLSWDETKQLMGYIQPGVSLFFPAGHAQIGNWNGTGYVYRNVSNSREVVGMIINSSYNGGYSAFPTWIDPDPVYNTYLNLPTIFDPGSALLSHNFGADPVNMLDGSFTVDSLDLSVGQPEPRGFSFSRHYDTNRRFYNDAKIGNGWTHNYLMKAEELSDPAAALGKTTPQAMAAFLVAMRAASAVFALKDYHRPVYGPYPPIPPAPMCWGVAALITHWGIDQLNTNAVTITLGKDAVEFIKQPDGSFTPPAGAKMTLTKPAGYQLQMRHGNTFKFHAKHKQVTNIVDQYSKEMKFTYTDDRRLKTVVDCWGASARTLTLAYDDSKRLISVSDGTGRKVGFGYTQKDLTSVTDPESKIWTYQYDTNHEIIATKDPTKRVITTNIYDSFGVVTQQWSQGDSARAWNIYVAGNRVSVQKDPKGGRTMYFYDEKLRLVATKDPNGNKSSSVYDGQDHVIQSITPKIETTQFEYDGRQNLTKITDPLLKIATFTYNSDDTLASSTDVHDVGTAGHSTTYEYNSKFSIKKITAPNVNDDSLKPDVVTFAYTETDVANGPPAGTLASQTDQENKTTSFQYDNHGEPSSVTHHNNTDPESYVVNAQGDVSSHTDANGIVTLYEYNKRRQPTKTTLDPSGLNIVTQIAYDDCGNASRTTDARGNSIVSSYSSTQKLLTNQFPQLADGSAPMTVNHYDERDWLDFKEDPLLEKGKTSLGYDSGGRLTTSTDPIGRVTTYGYDEDGHKTSVKSPLVGQNQMTQFGYSVRGEQISLTDAATHAIQYTYDADGNQLTVQNRNNKTFFSSYYGNNKLSKFQTPLQKTATPEKSSSFQYAQRGMINTSIEPSGQTTTYHYDDRGRLDSKSDLVGTCTYTYDKNNNLKTCTENSKTITRTYDHANRLQTYTDENGNTITYYYDKNGNVTNLIYPGTFGVTNFYDNLNRLSSVVDWANRKTTFTYDIASRLTSITRPNGAVRNLTYDNAGQLTDIEEKAPDGAILYRYLAPSYDGAGRQTSEFIYPSPTTFSPASVTATHNNDNQIATFQGNNAGYDDDGDMTSGPLNTSTAVTYIYDARNRLISVGGVTYTYDSEGNRLSITQSGQATTFVNDPSGQTLIRIRPNGTMTYYVYGAGLLYDVEMTSLGVETGSHTTHTYHFDIRGSTVALTDNSSHIIERMSYGPYGALASSAPTTDTPFLFNGRFGVMTDPNSLLYMRARYYNPYICRFINADPSGFSGGMNFYAYADGNPVKLVDPFGLGAYEPNGSSWFNDVATGLGFDTSREATAQREQAAAGFANFVTFGLAEDFSAAVFSRDLGNTRDVQGVERGIARFNVAMSLLPIGRVERVASKAAGEAGELLAGRAGTLAADLRAIPGIASGGEDLTAIAGKWMRGTDGNAGFFPGQIADQLRGRQFSSFDDFRGAFWKAVGGDQMLASQFSAANRALMIQGKAPFALDSQVIGSGAAQRVFNLHHINPIETGGGLYDMNNIIIAAPRYHAGLHGF